MYKADGARASGRPLETQVSIFKLHLATLLFGLSGVIGRISTIDVRMLVEARAGLAALALFFVARMSRIDLRVPRQKQIPYAAIGLLLGFHWYSFFYSIRLSGVSIGLLSFSSSPIFVILLAPLVNKSRLLIQDFLSIAAFSVGLILIINPSSIDQSKIVGALWGIGSGFSFAIAQIINKILVERDHPIKIAAYQNFGATLALLPFINISMLPETSIGIFQILTIGFICTAFAHTIFISGMKLVSAQTASMFTYLEPVYGIALATIICHDTPDGQTIVGATIILLSIYFSQKTQR
ncbi:DMT family transporter [Burkholderia sp. Ac-20392]|uniref:DMT family transporter n=1 Tax=Burkholderia sp. Ac-20392 TaxID=2703905 RepID=UPI00198199D8|nr:DMT family transporter [Burkholderia sp. Ac-20392]MBN3795987.1 EamA family transporter [Burkholderia sp. Ac-20392]